MHAEDEIQTCSLWRHDVSTILNRYLKAVDSVKDEVIWKSEKKLHVGYEVSNVFSYAFYKGVWAPVLTSQLVWEHQISSLGLLSLKPSFSFLLYQRNLWI